MMCVQGCSLKFCNSQKLETNVHQQETGKTNYGTFNSFAAKRKNEDIVYTDRKRSSSGKSKEPTVCSVLYVTFCLKGGGVIAAFACVCVVNFRKATKRN